MKQSFKMKVGRIIAIESRWDIKVIDIFVGRLELGFASKRAKKLEITSMDDRIRLSSKDLSDISKIIKKIK